MHSFGILKFVKIIVYADMIFIMIKTGEYINLPGHYFLPAQLKNLMREYVSNVAKSALFLCNMLIFPNQISGKCTSVSHLCPA
jgi:hypothetical protein